MNKNKNLQPRNKSRFLMKKKKKKHVSFLNMYSRI